MEPCRRFLKRVKRIRCRFWIVDPEGNVLLSEETGVPAVSREDLQKASGGEPVLSVRRRSPVRIILPMESPGKIKQLLVLERAVLPRRHLPRFPLLFSLLIAGVVVAILVLPLSRRLTRPLLELHELGVSWSEGRLEQRSKLRGKDEISDLAVTFNSMAGNLQRMLEQRKEFLALISHELKSPLARMRVALELLSEKDHADKQRQNLIQNMQEEITESEQLIEQLLVVSKIEMAPSHFSHVDVSTIAEKVVEQVTPRKYRESGFKSKEVSRSQEMNCSCSAYSAILWKMQSSFRLVVAHSLTVRKPQEQFFLNAKTQDPESVRIFKRPRTFLPGTIR
jgi:two-component system sensor histidine kinase CpxA